MKEQSYLFRRFNFNPETIYAVESDTDDTVLVAIKPKFSIIEHVTHVVWFDTNRDRIMVVKKVLEESDIKFTFEADNNFIYSFKPLTQSFFEEKIVPALVTQPSKDLIDLSDIYAFLNSALFDE